MTTAARCVLADCKFVLLRLEDEINDQQWRIHWVAAVALLRAVGHVLHKVDGKNPSVRGAANSQYREWLSSEPRQEIFREFIKRERDSVLKEYDLGVSEGPVQVAILVEDVSTGLWGEGQLESIGENIYRPIVGGPFAGEDGRTVIELSIEWWEERLDEIDRQTQLPSSTSSTKPSGVR